MPSNTPEEKMITRIVFSIIILLFSVDVISMADLFRVNEKLYPIIRGAGIESLMQFYIYLKMTICTIPLITCLFLSYSFYSNESREVETLDNTKKTSPASSVSLFRVVFLFIVSFGMSVVSLGLLISNYNLGERISPILLVIGSCVIIFMFGSLLILPTIAWKVYRLP